MWHFKLEMRVFDNVYNTSKVGSWEGTNLFFFRGTLFEMFWKKLPSNRTSYTTANSLCSHLQYVRWEKGHFCIKW